MSEWLDYNEAIALIRDARKASVAVVVKLLVEACAEGLVRTLQRPHGQPKGFGLSIPAFVWRDAHFDDGRRYEAGTDQWTQGQPGGYGLGINGIIDFNAEDLHYWLKVGPTPHWLNVGPTPRKQRAAPKGERIKEAIDALFPGGLPPQKDLPNPELIKRVCSYLKEHDYNVTFHPDVILRQAGRKAKPSRPI